MSSHPTEVRGPAAASAGTAAPSAEDPSAGPAEHQSANVRHIRGSSLLLFGRILGLSLDFVTQVLIVRHLSKTDYGTFAFVLSIVAIGTTACLLGLERTVGRFAPIYQEHRDYDRMWGTIAIVFGTVVTIGLGMIVAVELGHDVVEKLLSDDAAVTVLLIMIALAPLQALDSLLIAMFASFGTPRAIFFRRYVFAPVLELSVVIFLVLSSNGLRVLAGGYVLATALGILIYGSSLVRLLVRQGLTEHLNRRTIKLPFRELFSFSIPLLASDLVFVLRNSLTIILLQFFRDARDVADYRAVLPIAIQTIFVSTSFRFVFTPGASRLFARRDHKELNNLYWQTAVWIAILSFPVFAVGLAFSEPVSVFLFGDRYRDSGLVLSILVIGYYANAAFGFNSLLLRVFGRVRYMVATDGSVAVLSVIASVLLIREYGAIGAAVATTGSLILQNVLYQLGMRSRTTVRAFDRRYITVYVSIVVAAIALCLFAVVVRPNLLIGVVVSGVVSLAVLGVNRHALHVGEVYPELMRFGIIRRLFDDRSRRNDE